MSEENGNRGSQRSRHIAVAPAAALLAGSVLVSRGLGYLRDMLLADRVGAGAEADAYYAAFQIPDLLNYLLAGGALAIAFIPLYNRVREAGGEAASERFFANILTSVACVAVVGTGLLWVYAGELVALQFPRFDAATQDLTVRLTRIVLPAQVFFLTGGIVRAALMAHGRFGAQALAPLVYNAGVLCGGLATGTVEGFAWGVLAGSFVGPFALAFADLARSRIVRFQWRMALDRDMRAYLVLALPLMLGLSLATVDEWYERWFGALLATGTVAHLAYARKLMMAPVAVVGQAIGAALLPALARLHAEGRQAVFDSTLERTLRASLSLAIVAGGASWVFARPLVELVFRHGRFTETDAMAVVGILSILSLGVPAWVVQQVVARCFYARGDTWRPMILSTLVALAAIPVYLLLGREYGARGLAVAGVAAMGLNALATLGWARARFGSPVLGVFFETGIRVLVVAALSAGAVALVPTGLASGWREALYELGVGGLVYAVAVFLLGRFLGGEGLRDVLDQGVARLRRRGGSA